MGTPGESFGVITELLLDSANQLHYDALTVLHPTKHLLKKVSPRAVLLQSEHVTYKNVAQSFAEIMRVNIALQTNNIRTTYEQHVKAIGNIESEVQGWKNKILKTCNFLG